MAYLTATAKDWPWSSARAHLSGRRDGRVDIAPLRGMVTDWASFLSAGIEAPALGAFSAAERTGRPLGAADLVAGLEQNLGPTLARQKPGRKPKVEPVVFEDS